MMRSMFSGVSGLRVHQTKMDVIANNISNVNTTGFKSSRVTFAEIFAQTTAGATRANDETGRGGVNPMQIGLGSTVASIDLSTTQGAAQRTDNPYDLMIQGQGFFILGDGSGTYFSRAGAFNLDEAGNLVNPSGLKVMGWAREWNPGQAASAGPPPTAAVEPGWYIRRGQVQPFQVTENMHYAPPRTTTQVRFEDNLNAVDYTTGVESTVVFYDSLGNSYETIVTFSAPTPNASTQETTWTWTMSGTANIVGDNTMSYTYTAVTGTVVFDQNGIFASATPANPALATILLTPAAGTPAPPASNFTSGTGAELQLRFDLITQFGEQPTNIKSYTVDGYGPGTLINISIGSDGIINGLYSNGQMELLGQIVVARFRNPAGLEKFGDNLYIPTANSGNFDGIGEQVQLGGGKIMGGVLEMSNVDLAQEFTEMITTQRGFQANSRIITVSDDMLAELVNLKR